MGKPVPNFVDVLTTNQSKIPDWRTNFKLMPKKPNLDMEIPNCSQSAQEKIMQFKQVFSQEVPNYVQIQESIEKKATKRKSNAQVTILLSNF